MKSLKLPSQSHYFAFLFLILTTFALFSQVRHFEFINFDDDLYIVKNPHIQKGLTLSGIKWAFEADLIKPAENLDYWQPLTAISRLCDIQFFGLNPASHHLMNVFFHALNVFLLFLFLRKITGAFWRSFFVALLFAIYPVQAEAVAWVTSRKDVLCTFFGFLCMITYCDSVLKKSGKLYWISILLCAASLLSKPLFVTMPVLLILVDFWPLKRFQNEKIGKILADKIPFLLLSIFMIVLFARTQSRDAMSYLPPSQVILKAFVSYLDYFLIACDLAHLGIRNTNFGTMFASLRISIAFLFLTLLFAMSWRFRVKRPYVTFGLFWFLIALLPSVVLPVMGDRYLYVPISGVFIVVTWGIHDALKNQGSAKKNLSAAIITIIFIFLFVRSWIQIGYWKNSETVFRQALRVSEWDALAMNNLGTALMEQKRYTEAKKLFEKAIQTLPYYMKPYYNLAYLSSLEGKTEEAIRQYQIVIKIDPLYAEAYNDLGTLFIRQNRLDEARAYLEKALERKPIPRTYNNMGFVLEKEGKFDAAANYYGKALELDPINAEAQNNVGIALARHGKFDEAIRHFREALRLRADYPEARQNLEIMLLRQNSSGDLKSSGGQELRQRDVRNYS